MDRRSFLLSLSGSALGTVLPGAGYASSLPNPMPGERRVVVQVEPAECATGNQAIEASNTEPQLCVIAVGSAGGHVVSSLMTRVSAQNNFVAINTDLIGLSRVPAQTRILLGDGTVEMLTPNATRLEALNRSAEIAQAIKGADIVMVIAGLGGAAGTGIAPVVAEIAKASGALTVGVPILPFDFEGMRRNRIATIGLRALKRRSDCVVPIPNTDLAARLLPETAFSEVFEQCQQTVDTLYWNLVGSMTHGLVGVFPEDIREIASGTVALGWGSAQGASRVLEAAKSAIQHPLLGVARLKSTQGVHVAVRAEQSSLKMREVHEVLETIRGEVIADIPMVFSANYLPLGNGNFEVSILSSCGSNAS